jgi:hypothetical protein
MESDPIDFKAKDKKLGDISPEYGSLVKNAFVLDFMALGVAVIASRRGMGADVDTEFFPQKLFKLILEQPA